MSIFEQVKNEYRTNGYTNEQDFVGEYYFMSNPITMEKVRLYYTGQVREY